MECTNKVCSTNYHIHRDSDCEKNISQPFAPAPYELQIKLQQKGPLHGPRHLAAAIEQNATTSSSVVNLRIPLVVESALPTTPNAIMTADMIGEDIWSVILAHAPDGQLVFALTCRVLRDVVGWHGQRI